MPEPTPAQIIQHARSALLQGIVADLADVVVSPSGVRITSFADTGNKKSVAFATEWLARVNGEPPQWTVNVVAGKRDGQVYGNQFEELVKSYIEASYIPLAKSIFGNHNQRVERYTIGGDEDHEDATVDASFFSKFYQYHGLETLAATLKSNPHLAASLGNIYEVRPDVVVYQKKPLSETEQMLTACVSCKWTIRSDRVQNTRVEARNLINNRVARAPQIVAVTVEPLPSRLKAIAAGTGEIDCTYHVDLPALVHAVEAVTRATWKTKWDRLNPARRRMTEVEYIEAGLQSDPQWATLNMLITGRRLKDIIELPADLLM